MAQRRAGSGARSAVGLTLVSSEAVGLYHQLLDRRRAQRSVHRHGRVADDRHVDPVRHYSTVIYASHCASDHAVVPHFLNGIGWDPGSRLRTRGPRTRPEPPADGSGARGGTAWPSGCSWCGSSRCGAGLGPPSLPLFPPDLLDIYPVGRIRLLEASVLRAQRLHPHRGQPRADHDLQQLRVDRLQHQALHAVPRVHPLELRAHPREARAAGAHRADQDLDHLRARACFARTGGRRSRRALPSGRLPTNAGSWRCCRGRRPLRLGDPDGLGGRRGVVALDAPVEVAHDARQRRTAVGGWCRRGRRQFRQSQMLEDPFDGLQCPV